MLPALPQVPHTARAVGSYLLVVIAAWAGAAFAADWTVDQARQDRYTADIEACDRGNLTVRGPLVAFARALQSEDDLPADIHRAATSLGESAAPVDCEAVVNQP